MVDQVPDTRVRALPDELVDRICHPPPPPWLEPLAEQVAEKVTDRLKWAAIVDTVDLDGDGEPE